MRRALEPIANPNEALPLELPDGFRLEAIALLPRPRHLAALPNGDLLVGSVGRKVYLIPNAEAEGLPDQPVTFTEIDDVPLHGVAFDATSCTVYVAGQHGVYALSYTDGQLTAKPGDRIVDVRAGDDSGHYTTSLAVAGGVLYAGIGSTCDACVERDPIRATIQQIDPKAMRMVTRATRFRNAIALAENPETGTLWAGGAGQDRVAKGHPFEFFDAVTLRSSPVADYGWPDCEERRIAYVAGADCSQAVVPLVELPAYSTIMAAAFYPSAKTGEHTFPEPYRGGVYLAAHGSFHIRGDGHFAAPPRVVFVPMRGDEPRIAVDWSDPTRQWIEVIGGFELADGATRLGRPAGLAVGAKGSLFISDDLLGMVFRVRPL